MSWEHNLERKSIKSIYGIKSTYLGFLVINSRGDKICCVNATTV